jgi:hypothetical protein
LSIADPFPGGCGHLATFANRRNFLDGGCPV